MEESAAKSPLQGDPSCPNGFCAVRVESPADLIPIPPEQSAAISAASSRHLCGSLSAINALLSVYIGKLPAGIGMTNSGGMLGLQNVISPNLRVSTTIGGEENLPASSSMPSTQASPLSSINLPPLRQTYFSGIILAIIVGSCHDRSDRQTKILKRSVRA